MEETREMTEEVTNEVMEPVTETYEVSGDTEGGSGKALVVALAVGAGIATAGKVVYDRLKAKKTGKPKKKRHFHIGWVEDAEPEERESEERESEVIDLDDEDVEVIDHSEEK